jgi:hypothetical protein
MEQDKEELKTNDCNVDDKWNWFWRETWQSFWHCACTNAVILIETEKDFLFLIDQYGEKKG